MAGASERSLEGASARPAAASLPADRHGEGHTPFPPEAEDGSIGARLEQVVDEFGENTAIVGKAGSLTFAELDQQVNQGANGLLARLGDGEEPVVLLFDHDTDLVVAFLAVLKAGKAVLVLDPEAPEPLAEEILADSASRLLVCGASQEGKAAAVIGDGCEIVGWADLIAGQDTGRPAIEVTPDRAAMLAYTSGTTGAAKAAVLPHRALLHLAHGAVDALAVGSGDRLPMLFPISLAVASYPMLLPLLTGGTLCILDLRSEGLAPFPAWLVEQQISVLYISPTVAKFLGDVGDTTFPDLRLVVLGGERVDADAVAAVRAVFGQDCVIGNGYGTTETGVLSFYFTELGETGGEAGVPVGWPITGTGLHIVDASGLPLPAGSTGELHVSGHHLLRGYWNRPDLDARVLYTGPDGVPRYRTGDLARLDESGCLEIRGRSDSEVKIRGHRVVPGDVEQALLRLPEVKDAVVEARLALKGGHRLVAFVVAADVDAGDPTAIRNALADVVKPSHVPDEIVLLDQLPLLPNGKLDRRALPDPGPRPPVDPDRFEEPRDPLEQQILELWQEVLPDRVIGVHDDFDDLGGQSLDAAWLLIRLEEDTGVRLPMGEMLHVRTVAQMADRHRQLKGARRGSLTVVQEGDPSVPTLWFIHDLHGSAYSVRHLAPLLGEDRPVIGFDSPFLEETEAPFTRLETLALRYITEMRRYQPEGPYLLAGYSFGGVLAFEMARQLREAGAEVPFLGVVDVGPGYRGRHYNPRRVLDKPWLKVPGPPPDDYSTRQRLGYYGDMVRRSKSDALHHLSLRVGTDRWTDEVEFAIDRRRYGGIHPGRRLWFAWRRHWDLARKYQWDGLTYPGPMTLFWAEESASTDATMGWGSIITSGLEIVRVPGPHDEMLQAHRAATLAGPLRDALDRC